jgi:hypothetical protein
MKPPVKKTGVKAGAFEGYVTYELAKQGANKGATR